MNELKVTSRLAGIMEFLSGLVSKISGSKLVVIAVVVLSVAAIGMAADRVAGTSIFTKGNQVIAEDWLGNPVVWSDGNGNIHGKLSQHWYLLGGYRCEADNRELTGDEVAARLKVEAGVAERKAAKAKAKAEAAAKKAASDKK